MIWLGLALMVVYVPGWTGATVPTSWALLSLVLPALALWRTVILTALHWAILSWAALAWVAVVWSLNTTDALWGAWQVTLFALAFWLGSSLSDRRPLWLGLGLGLNLATLFAIAQAIGYDPVLVNTHIYPSALFYNSMLYGEICAVVILGLFVFRLWWLIPLPLFGLVLSHSHGGWLALGVGLIAWRFRSLSLLGLLALIAAVAFTYHFRPSDAERLQAWYAAVTNLAWFGHGPGSFLSVWYQPDAHSLIFPQYVHNDYLQLVFEYGLLAVVPFAALALPLANRSAPEWPVYVAFLLMGTYSFPLYSHVLPFLGAICAGGVARDWALHWDRGSDRGHDLLSRLHPPQQDPYRDRGQTVSVVSRA